MELREALVANAPQEIPDWFKHIEPTKPKPPRINPNLHVNVRMHLKAVLDKNDSWHALSVDHSRHWAAHCGMTPEEAEDLRISFSNKLRAYKESLKVWEVANEKARIGQWPWAWAELILKHRR